MKETKKVPNLKQKVLESLKTKGYHDYQLKELNPIIQATIEATKQALNIPYVVGQSEQLKAFADFLFDKEYLVRRSVDEVLEEFESL